MVRMAKQDDSLATDQWGFSTRAIHSQNHSSHEHGALNPPIYYTSTYGFESAEQCAARFSGDEPGMIYSRITNPTVQLLESRLANLENGEAAVAFGSGMGAISSLVWTFLRPNDEVIVDATLYGCTHSLVNHILPEFGIKVHPLDLTDPNNLKIYLNSNTKLVFFETPANPNMRLIDIAKVAETVKANCSAMVVVDSTYCTPYLQRPLDLGADMVIHSLTKYLNGHGDVIAGAAIGTNEAMTLMRKVGLKELTGACLSPMDAYLVLRGIKTLPIRMEKHCASATKIAAFLESHPQAASVAYPGLTSHPAHKLANRQMKLPGAMIAFEAKGGVEHGRQFMNRLTLWTRAVSLGDAESLAEHPASMTHASYTAEERKAHLISEGLVRLSVGLEDVDDLIKDLDQALG